MAKITLLLDEDVRPILGEILRQRGYDAVHVLDAGRTGQSDAEGTKGDRLLSWCDGSEVILTLRIRAAELATMLMPRLDD